MSEPPEDEICFILDEYLFSRLQDSLNIQLVSFIDMIAKDMGKNPVEMYEQVMPEKKKVAIYAKKVCEKEKKTVAKSDEKKREPVPSDLRCCAVTWGAGSRSRCSRKRKNIRLDDGRVINSEFCQYHWLWDESPAKLPFGRYDQPIPPEKLKPREKSRIEDDCEMQVYDRYGNCYFDEKTHRIFTAGDFRNIGYWTDDEDGSRSIHHF